MTKRAGGGNSTVRGDEAHLPPKPPLVLLKADSEWLVTEFPVGARDEPPQSTYERRVAAISAAKSRLADHGHPCLLRWTPTRETCDIYWNPLYEQLDVRYDQLVGSWVVVPRSGHVFFHTARERRTACRRAREVQHDYHFRKLTVFAPNGERRQSVAHRFLESPPDRPASLEAGEGTRSDHSDAPSSTDADRTESTTPEAATPASALDAASVDLTAVAAVDTTGAVHHYRAVDTDDRSVYITTVAPEFTSDRSAMSAFMSVVTQWQEISDATHVARVHDIGIGPAPWVAYRAGEAPLRDRLDDISVRERCRLVSDVASALDTAMRYNVPRRGVTPTNVRLVRRDGRYRARLANWGLEREIENALGEIPVTPYTAPEQLETETTPTTGIYQLGALTYRLLTDRVPFADSVDLEASIETGNLRAASDVRELPGAVDTVLSRAMDPEPRDRYTSSSTFRDRLRESLEAPDNH